MIEPVIDSPKYIDLALEEINTKLKTTFSWIDNAFGLSYRHVIFRSNINDPRFNAYDYYPGIFKGGDQDNYLTLFPNEDFGNFCFWDLEEDQEEIKKDTHVIIRRLGCVFWFDYRDIFGDGWERKTLNNVKYLLLDGFFNNMYFSKSSIETYSMNERVDNIYRNYNHREVDSQFLMMPFGALRINMEIKINRVNLC